jgi:hypothetical protein
MSEVALIALEEAISESAHKQRRTDEAVAKAQSTNYVDRKRDRAYLILEALAARGFTIQRTRP